jgi:hypothetical protein
MSFRQLNSKRETEENVSNNRTRTSEKYEKKHDRYPDT